MILIKKFIGLVFMIIGSLIMTPIVLAVISGILIFFGGIYLFLIGLNLWEF